ncbi:MAG TPA: hypothetical protein PLP86_13380, partial [Armatimonadota bacterium]|nr:hypothetical protein [Armatimonadota bacterium]
MLIRIVPIALAVSVAIGVLAELAFTRSRTFTITSALTDAETATITIVGTVTPHGQNNYILEDKTGKIELQTCPSWYRRILLDHNEKVAVTGAIIKNNKPPEGTLYSLAVFKIERQGKPEIVLRRKPGKPPW